MCGRYSITAANLEQRFSAKLSYPYEPRFNAAPSQQLPLILSSDPAAIIPALWGFVPAWAKSPADSFTNARSETANLKPTFRKSFLERRCLVPASGFFEWKRTPDGSVPYFFTLEAEPLFSFAGVWRDAGKGPTFTVLTTRPNSLCARVHHRMPAIVPRGLESSYLNDDTDTALRLAQQPFPASKMTSYQVSKLVNSPMNDSPGILEPAA